MSLILSKLWAAAKLNIGSIVFTSVALAFVVAGLAIAGSHWEWLRTDGTAAASNGDTLRNVGILIGLLVAFVFGLWRAWLQGLQTNASQEQVKTAQHQAATAREGQLNDQYQRGAEMLGSGILAVRLGGIYTLQRLAEDHADLYHIQIMQLFCAFAKNPTDPITANIWEELRGSGSTEWPRLRADLQAIISFIGLRGIVARTMELSTEFTVDLSETRLNGADMSGLDMTGVRFFETELIDANMTETILAEAELTGSNLYKAVLEDADCSHANL